MAEIYKAEDFDYCIDGPSRIHFEWLPDVEDFPAGLRERIERIARLEEKPDWVGGQRSSFIGLEESIGNVNTLQIKGHFYRTTSDGHKIIPPHMVAYQGQGHPIAQFFANANGNLKLRALKDIPRGPILEVCAASEFQQMAAMTHAGLPIVRPYAIGKFEDMIFNVRRSLEIEPEAINPMLKQMGAYENQEFLDEEYHVYCLVIGIPGKEPGRAMTQIVEMTDGMGEKKKKDFLESFFRAYGATMAQFLEEGFILGSPHLENISIIPGDGIDKPSRMSSRLDICMHDPGIFGVPAFKRTHFTGAEWDTYVFIDVTNATEALMYFFDDAEYFKMAEEKIGEARVPMVRRFKRLWQVSQDARFNPTQSYFEGLLGDDISKVPVEHFSDKTRVDLTTQAKLLMSNPNIHYLEEMFGREVNIVKFLYKANPLVGAIREKFA